MKRTRILRFFGCLPAVVTFLGLAAAPGLKAEFECKQELWAGAWVQHAELWILEREGRNIFPPPGPFSAAGTFVFDE